MTAFICKACGTQYPPADEPPAGCRICDDERQFVPVSGQQWTTLGELRSRHRNSFEQHEPDLTAIETTPEFAIGQRAFLLRTGEGNFLWDCIALLDDATVELVRALGRLRGIAISHPHYYTTMLEWSAAFANAPIYLHAADQEWVGRRENAIEFWNGETKTLAPGVTLVRCGGHFPGGTVLHWANGADNRGVLLSGDILQVGPDGFVSFMYSYPNLIPLPPRAVKAVGAALRPFAFDRIYGAFSGRTIQANGTAKVAQSVERYVRAIEDQS